MTGIDTTLPHWQLGLLDGHAQAELVRRGEATPAELVEAAFLRIDDLNPSLNAVSWCAREEAPAAAARVDRALPMAGPMAGVPLLLKASMSYPGFPQVSGSRSRQGDVGSALYPFGAAIDAAGLIPCGISTMPEFGLMGSGEALVYGPTRNPWDLSRGPGGSSSGAGAAVAAGLVPFATGSDGGGSIRIPAAHCGIVGFKPGRGWNLRARGSNLIDDLFACDALMARTMRDAAWAARRLRSQPAGEGGPPRRLRIALNLVGLDGELPDPDVAAAIRAAGELCASLGHAVEERLLPIDNAAAKRAFELLWAYGAGEVADMTRARFPARPAEDLLEPWTLGLAAIRDRAAPCDLAEALARIALLRQRMEPFWQEWDVVLSPVASSAALPIGVLAPDREFEGLARDHFRHVNYTQLQNMGGWPGISLPLGRTEAGLPVGAMFWAPHGADDLLLALGHELEDAADWRGNWPPVIAP